MSKVTPVVGHLLILVALLLQKMADKPIIHAVTNDAYDRMMAQLRGGAPYVYTYRNVCPHGPSTCRCPKWKNFLKDGKIVREGSDGTLQEVLSLSMLR